MMNTQFNIRRYISPLLQPFSRQGTRFLVGFQKLIGNARQNADWMITTVAKGRELSACVFFINTSTCRTSPVQSHPSLGHFTWQERMFLSVALSGNIS